MLINQNHKKRNTQIVRFVAITAVIILTMLISGCSNEKNKTSNNIEQSINSKSETYTHAPLKNVEEGGSVVFGNYEQDNNTYNGKEEIEWLVLDKQDGKALLLSKYVLDGKAYNNFRANITWESSTLRGWLNNEFINEAFAASEQSIIQITNVHNDDNSSGNSTQDKIFLLDSSEFEKYFDGPWGVTSPTDYALSQGVYNSNMFNTYKVNGKNPCCWWLRSISSNYTYSAHIVNHLGQLLSAGSNVDESSNGVRPAMWVVAE